MKHLIEVQASPSTDRPLKMTDHDQEEQCKIPWVTPEHPRRKRVCSDKQTEPQPGQMAPHQKCNANDDTGPVAVDSNECEEARRTAIKMMQRWTLQYSILMEQYEQMVYKQQAKAERFWRRAVTIHLESCREKWSLRARHIDGPRMIQGHQRELQHLMRHTIYMF